MCYTARQKLRRSTPPCTLPDSYLHAPYIMFKIIKQVMGDGTQLSGSELQWFCDLCGTWRVVQQLKGGGLGVFSRRSRLVMTQSKSKVSRTGHCCCHRHFRIWACASWLSFVTGPKHRTVKKGAEEGVYHPSSLCKQAAFSVPAAGFGVSLNFSLLCPWQIAFPIKGLACLWRTALLALRVGLYLLCSFSSRL